jgi:hypothetical protein
MITKNDAIVLFNNYNAGFSQRVDQLIRSAASSGLTNVVISYANVTNAVANSVAAELISAGWSVVNDAPGKTITIS